MKFNRLDPDYLREWRENFRGLFEGFAAGNITMLEAIDVLRHLGFKDDALRVEVVELQRAKREAKGPALQLVVS